MEVTKRNFIEVLPDVEEAIKHADFIAIDGEFTGLSSSSINPFDAPFECYQHFRDSCREFLLVQFGLSLFRWDQESKSYKYCTYVFYVYPRHFMKATIDKIFGCQSSSIDFLVRHKFDFNKLFYEGISYIDTAEEVKLREYIEEKQNNRKNNKGSFINSPPVKVPDNLQPLISKICSDVGHFLKTPGEEAVHFELLNSFHRKLAYQELEAKFKNLIHIETKTTEYDKRVLVVTHALSEKERLARIEVENEKEWAEMDAAVGFSSIARLISDSHKLVAGHHIILDLMHVINSFLFPLPDVYNKFKSLATNIFPRVIDTMYMAKAQIFRDIIPAVGLESLYETIRRDPFEIPKIEPETKHNMKGYDLHAREFHNAGYDSFVTGICLLTMTEYLKKNIHFIEDQVFSETSNILIPFMNKLFLYTTAFEGSPYINLGGNDLNPSRDHVFHIKFPTEWKRTDITDIFEIYGGLSTVAFIDNTSAFVALKQPSKSESVMMTLCLAKESFKLTPYRDYKAMLVPPKENIRTSKCSSTEEQNSSDDNELSNDEIEVRKILKRKHDEDINSINSTDSEKEVTNSQCVGSSTSRNNKNIGTKVNKHRKERKVSNSTSGNFVVSSNDRAPSTSQIFPESNNWE